MSLVPEEKSPLTPVPVNLITGPLGVGKTTTINYLLSQRPKEERWAVLVNEYGLVGIDSAMLEGEAEVSRQPGVMIREVSGGCICCSAGFMFEVSLTLLLQRKPHRLLIEPTGLAAISGILDTLARPGIRQLVDVRSILCLVDPTRLEQDWERDEVFDQISAADVLLASRADLATEGELDAFEDRARGLFPPLRFLGPLHHGQVPLSMLDLVRDRAQAPSGTGYLHGADSNAEQHPHQHAEAGLGLEYICDSTRPMVFRSHRSAGGSTFGWVCWQGLVFHAERVSCWLSELSKLPGARRAKAVLHTNEGWWSFNFADGIEAVRPSGYRRDSRLEVVLEGDQLPPETVLQHGLMSCLETQEVFSGI